MQNFPYVCIIMVIIVTYLLMNKKYQFKSNNKNVVFQTQFCLGKISHKFNAIDSEEVCLKENVYDFSFEYNSIDKSDLLMTKNSILNVWMFLKKILSYY